jgi:ribonuclease T2
MSRRFVVGLCIVAAVAMAFAKHHRHAGGSSTNNGSTANAAGSGNFDYYLLSLSWAPNYCHDHPSDHSSECRSGGRQGFVLHGLWPQTEEGRPPMACGSASSPDPSLVDSMLQYFPSRGLIQHEWEEHGTCSGLSPEDYFHQAEQAYKRLQIPEPLRNVSREIDLSVSDLERSFAQANHAPVDAVRVSCHAGELVNLEVCLSKDLQFRSCSASVRECPGGDVSLLAPE